MRKSWLPLMMQRHPAFIPAKASRLTWRRPNPPGAFSDAGLVSRWAGDCCALGIGAVPGEPSIDFGAGKVFSHVLLCAGNMALVRWFLGPDILLLVENL